MAKERDENLDFDAEEEQARTRRSHRRPSLAWTLLALAGALLLTSGLVLLLYFWGFHDTTVWIMNERAYNLGKVSDKLAGMIAGGVFATLGAIFTMCGLLARRSP